MKYDLVALLSLILKEAGLANAIDRNLSNHSTISLNMKDDIPTINICEDEGQVWVWAKLGDYNLSTLTYASSNLFPIMLNHNEELFYCGQPCLYTVSDNLELRAQVKEEFLESPESFLKLLDNYLTILQDYRTVLA